MFMFVSNLMVFSFCIRICEYNIRRIDGNPDFSIYINDFWFISVTMSTVGYGDYIPQTQLGKFIAFLTCLWGIFFVSITFVSLINMLKLSIKEQNIFNISTKMEYSRKVKNKASDIIKTIFRFRKAYKDRYYDKSYYHKIRFLLLKDKLRKLIIEFKQVKREMTENTNDLDIIQYISENIENINFTINKIEESQFKILTNS